MGDYSNQLNFSNVGLRDRIDFQLAKAPYVNDTSLTPTKMSISSKKDDTIVLETSEAHKSI